MMENVRRGLVILFVFAVACLPPAAVAEQKTLPAEPEPLGIAMEGYEYPYPVHFRSFQLDGQDVRMAYMDVQPAGTPTGQTVVLFHGKNFFGAYWENTIKALSAAGRRVVIPDQIGFGKSSKPIIQYSFHKMGRHTHALLDMLGVGPVAVVGHSMGGMVASRFTLMYPDRVTHLILENPIGLEDYRQKVPYATTDQIYQAVLNRTEEELRAYHKGYYVTWKPSYEEYVQVHYRWTLSGDYPRFAMVSALTAQMVYEQPVVHEFPLIQAKTLLVIGQEDRTALGKGRVSTEVRATLGQYPELGRKV
ncbi:MAG TPA: alpha/beta hydrolase, partial [Bryobacterales bacterium]|nr:alpha/beta hydrolase [Bryobacterales bacterium]